MINISLMYQHPLEALSFFSLILAISSLWIRKTLWIWGFFAFISLLTAFGSGLLHLTALLPLAFFGLLLWGLQLDLKGFSRFLIAATAFLIGAALCLRLMPSFFNLSSLPYPLCLNYGKVFVGLILLGWTIPTLSSKSRLQSLKKVFLYAAIGLVFSSLVFVFVQHKAIYTHFSFSFFPWALFSLFFIIIPEEALLRGFLQKELVYWMGGGFKSEVCAVIILAFLYPLFHLSWASDLSLLLPTFALGLTYATIYQMSKLIETSIVCHFLTTCSHFIFFGHLPFFQKLPCLGLGL